MFFSSWIEVHTHDQGEYFFRKVSISQTSCRCKTFELNMFFFGSSSTVYELKRTGRSRRKTESTPSELLSTVLPWLRLQLCAGMHLTVRSRSKRVGSHRDINQHQARERLGTDRGNILAKASVFFNKTRIRHHLTSTKS